MSVIATLEFHDGVPSGESAREPNGAQRGLGAGAHHAYLVHRGDQRAHALRHLRLEHGRGAEAEAPRGRFAHGVDHPGVGVSDHRRTPCADVVHEAPGVDIEQQRPLRAFEEHRGAADGPECADGRVDSAGDALLRAFEFSQ